MASAGCDVAIHYHGSARAARALADEIAASGVRAEAFRADLSHPDGPDDLARQVLRRMGRLDYLVGSAANFLKQSFSQTDARIFDEAMNLNARSSLLLARAAASELRKRKGRVVLISDLAARYPWRHYSAHSISKAAVEMCVKVLARELAPRVSVNGIAPGTILPPKAMPKAAVAQLVSRIPLSRIGSPQDVARTVRFFCEGPAFITGQILAVDGGRSIV
jgi:pteridine reductase